MVCKNNASVSVIIPCYCCSETIERALDSVVAQTLLPKEVILIEDASPDDGQTLSVFDRLKDKYQDYFEVMFIFNHANKGPGSSRNIGWEASTQSYIAFLDADDSWHPKKLEIQYEWMIEHSDCVLSGHLCNLWKARNDVADVSSCKKVVTLSKLSLMLKSPFSTPTVMIKRDINFRFRDSSFYAEDYLLWQQISYSGHWVARIECSLANIHKELYGDDGLSSHMWAMEKGELFNYWLLYRQSLINIVIVSCLSLYSLMKFVRRFVIVCFRRITV